MRVAFKKAIVNGWFDGWYGFFITINNWRRLQFNSFCHAELVFDTPNGESFSCIESDTDDNGNKTAGCRYKQITYSHQERWVFLEWDYKDKRWPKQYNNEDEIREVCKSMLGAGYDWTGIVGQGLRLDSIQDDKKYFCSEGVGHVMGFNNHPSPARLYQMMKERLKA